jgi:hypothetical protein
MTWYAADDDDAADDPRAWRKANPALAEGRIPESAIRSSLYSMTPSAFRSERLNLWAEGGDEWLPPGTWRQREAEQPSTGIRIVLGAEAVPSWRRVTVTVAIVTDAGAWVGIAGELDSARSGSSSIAPGELIRLVDGLAQTWHPTEVAYSAAAAAAPHLTDWAETMKVRAVALGPRQIKAASQLFRSELIGSRLWHGPTRARSTGPRRPAVGPARRRRLVLQHPRQRRRDRRAPGGRVGGVGGDRPGGTRAGPRDLRLGAAAPNVRAVAAR